MADEIELIDINKAGVAELTQVSGIGEGLARRIIEYRETVHPFEEVIELAAVPGISERMARQFADQVTVEPAVVMEKTAVPPTMALKPVEEIEESILPEVEEVEPEAAVAAEVEIIEPEPEPENEELVISEVEGSAPEQSTPEIEAETAVPSPVIKQAPSESERLAPEPTPVVVPPPAPETRPRRMLGTVLLGSILGAFVGALLTLAILAALNGGTLSFAQADARLRNAIEDTRQTQANLSQALDGFNTGFSADLRTLNTRADDLAGQQQTLDQSVQSMNRALEGTQEDVTKLAGTAVELDEKLTSVAAAAETFDAFLEGLRNLLVDLQGLPAPTMTPYVTPTPKTTLTATPDTETTPNAAAATSAATAHPTRTPRPTATPILPTSTPGQQP